MSEEGKQKLFAHLEKLEIKTETKEHPKADTMDELLKYAIDLFPNAVACKNLFVKEKGKNILYLIHAKDDTVINLSKFSKFVGLKNLRFATEDLLKKYLNVPLGTVTPFALYHAGIDNKFEINVVLDSNIKDKDSLLFHPLENDKSTSISSIDLEKFIKSCNFDFKYVDFSQVQ
eukprot:gene12072-5565_t